MSDDPSPIGTGRDIADELYRKYADPLRQFVRCVAVNWGMSESLVDTEGVVHEPFAAMFSSRGIIENPPAWLFTVASRLVGKNGTARDPRNPAPTR